jgi:hypothetical protein
MSTAKPATTSNSQKSKIKDNLLGNLTVALFVLGLFCVGYVIYVQFSKKASIAKTGNLDCVKKAELQAVSDEFMAGLLEKDAKVKVLENFYNCNAPKVGDLAWYRFSDQIPPVVRFIRGVPGDRYTLKESSDKKGFWTISINNKEVMTSSGPYLIQSSSVPPLKTYELSRNGLLLDDEYILLGNTSPSISDSSNLGLIHKKNLIGKVVLDK